jgi:ABC-type polysaccharide/polyol phosphate export permease
MRLLKAGYEFLLLIVHRRSLIWEMAKRDVAQKYAGSWLGLFWTVIHPLALICIFWFVFGFGLRSQPVADVPYAVWLTAGLAAWFALFEIVAESTTMITANPHLIKKILFPSQVLPVVKIVSAFLNHMVFLALLLILLVAQGHPPGLGALQFLYYYFCLTMLAVGVSWLTSALNVFIRDVAQAVQLLLQIFFWATPIVWDPGLMPERVRFYLKLNPVYYIVAGYRESFVSFVPFWEHPHLAAYFWAVTLLVFVLGAAVFRKLKPHFADVI